MGILGKLFGSSSKMEKMLRALEQKNYVEALHLGEDLQAAGDESVELNECLTRAADGLARLNLEEGLRSRHAGDMQLAVEHLELALSQARSAELIKQVEIALEQDANSGRSTQAEQSPSAPSGSACGSCSPTSHAADVAPEDIPDLQSQIELIVASYPAELQQRYLARSDAFLTAFLLVQNGDDHQALTHWELVPKDERDELYLFELGCLFARQGEADRGMDLLRQALKLDPENVLIIDSLLSMLLEKGDSPGAQRLLQQQLESGASPAFCYARQCELQTALADPAAIDSARNALAEGYAEPDFLVLAAGLFEAAGEIDRAEQLLSGLPGGGCGGGVNLPLAEFWLRQNKELAKVLDAFNAACRQEPDNPRWQLRVAQTYLARKWRKQGIELLQRVVGDPRLEDALRLEAEQKLAEV